MKKKLSALALGAAMLVTAFMPLQPVEAAKAQPPVKAEQLTNLIDLHLHLDGSISLKSAKELAKLQNIPLNYTDAELKQKLSVGKDCRSLNEYLEKFAFPNELLQTKVGVSKAVYNLMRELQAKKFAYAEIRFAPQKSCDKGMTQEEAVLAAIEGLKQAPMPGKLILCCMRGDNNKAENLETVRLAAKYLGKGVGAVDLAGAEALFPTATFADVFAEAKAKGVPMTIHAGEADGPASVNVALDFGASRIGHGIRSLEDKKTVKRLVDNNITLEICPTSNLNTAMFQDIKSYPLKKLQKSGIKYTINTDNMSVSNTSLQREYQQLIDTFKLSKKDIGGLLVNSVAASFADAETKAMLDSRIRTVYGLEANPKVEKIQRRIIIDTDTAGDDAAAMMLALRSPDIKVEGITVLAGNVNIDQAVKNALMTTEVAEVKVPVYKGSSTTYTGKTKECFSVFGKDGMGDKGIINPVGKAEAQDGIDFILDTVRKNPGEIELVCLGPATDVAFAIDRDPETMKKVKRIWSMGTAGFGIGNATPVAEFNVFVDAPAYKKMLDLGVPTTIIGLDMNREATWLPGAKVEEMMNSDVKTHKFLGNACSGLLSFLRENKAMDYADLPDAVAMAAVVWPDFVQATTIAHGSCILDEGENYGQVVMYRKGIAYDAMLDVSNTNLEVVTMQKDEDFVERLLNTIK